MEFEELKVEIPVDDSEDEEKETLFSLERRYENKTGCFVTGFDVTSKEALERKARRAKRFGLQQKDIHNNPMEGQSDQETDTMLSSVNPKDLPPIPEGVARLDAIHVFGVDNMSTKDIFLYFDNYGPGSVEWIDDSCCNVVWDDNYTASRVLLEVGKKVEDESTTGLAIYHSDIGGMDDNANNYEDKKQPGAAQRSLYYLINGNPNTNGNKGAKKGLVSGSRKRKIQKERERVKHLSSGGPDVLFLDKVEEDDDEKMEIDEPPLKIMVTNEGPVEKIESSNLRMRMYADSLKEDDSDESDDDRREKRDKWKGRIGKKAEKREESREEKREEKLEEKREEKWEEMVKPPPKTLDLRNKLASRERHGFHFKNRPSLSIEIKEEPAS
ncbi:PREDICTED: nuclear cap-binding protein subunit 3-like [Acropora digitifera]|uniref:nuclear cap-binding protein subunit 3-like n=1 Tax=Acropora digitifera TaxID=70779 RepID=UPI00077B1C9B|nr:PREDICTED: nuclear cap-binding protein subunit 3-like [Acropora digitifera]